MATLGDTPSFRVTSQADAAYNCIAWAAGEDDRWWWPSEFAYWPPGVPQVETLPAFIAAYGTLGYEISASGDLEPGYVKIGLYIDAGGTPTHAARQLPNGAWTSKHGQRTTSNMLRPMTCYAFLAVRCMAASPSS